MKADTKAIQAIHDTVITFNPRVKVTGDLTTTFNLHIDSVHEGDRGIYMCQINTVPMMSQSASLDVLVPPDIDVDRSSPDPEIRVGAVAKFGVLCRWISHAQHPVVERGSAAFQGQRSFNRIDPEM